MDAQGLQLARHVGREMGAQGFQVSKARWPQAAGGRSQVAGCRPQVAEDSRIGGLEKGSDSRPQGFAETLRSPFLGLDSQFRGLVDMHRSLEGPCNGAQATTLE